VDALDGPVEPTDLAWLGFNAVALILLADVATAAARLQRRARDEALRASRFDVLTGLYNRGFFFTTMEQEVRRSDRMGRGFSLLMLDLDGLKPVNDRFGHQWGDRLLRAVADTIRRTVRFTDAAARYGGDEFVVLLPETDAAGGYVVAEKLRRDIAALTLHAADRVVRSSVSVGLVTYPDDGTTIEQLVAAADVAMYESKRRGKNRIVGYQTRTERVATAIEVEVGEAASSRSPGMGGDRIEGERPADASGLDVRTGGDPAPWGPTAIAATGMEPPLPRPARTQRVVAPPPEEDGSREQPWLTRTDGTSAPRPGPSAETPPSSSAGPDLRPAAELPPTQRPAAELPPTQRPAAELPPTSRAAADQPPTMRPAADQPPTSRPMRRSDEIRRSSDRPWIALPIEPLEPPDRPLG
jgi:diguanylate cyclase (GGDEF)-like protein